MGRPREHNERFNFVFLYLLYLSFYFKILLKILKEREKPRGVWPRDVLRGFKRFK